MLDDSLKAQLNQYLVHIQHPIRLRATLDTSTTGDQLRELLEELAQMSSNIDWTDDGTSERTPSFRIERPGTPIAVEFAGVPLGHEFSSLVLALIQVGGHPVRLEPSVIRRVQALEGIHRFETYMSLSCHSCPETVQALNMMSILNPAAIQHVAIEGGAFQEEIASRQVMAVPTVYHNGEMFDSGRMGVEDLLRRLEGTQDRREAQELMAKPVFDVLVVGGGPAGAAAALYAARKGIRTGLVAERFGGQVLDTLGIENLPSVPYTEGPRLAADLEQHVRQQAVDLILHQRVTAMERPDPAAPLILRLASGGQLSTHALILAPGAQWRALGVPGEDAYRRKGVTYCPHCDGPLFKGKRVAVIGGGNSGVEAAIDLAGVVTHVTLLEYAADLKADAVLRKKLATLPNVTVLTQVEVLQVEGDGKRVQGLVYRDRTTQAVETLDLEGVFVQIGLVPQTEWLRDSVPLNARGEIVVDHHGATDQPGVFAAGDATHGPYKQIVTAMGEGSRAALAAFEYLIRQSPGTTA